MKILCFHPALAPYRLDFFNLLAEKADLKILFLQTNLHTQKFDQKALRGELSCRHDELTRGFDLRGRCIRFGVRRAIKIESPDIVLSYESSPVTLLLILYKKIFYKKLKIWTSMDDSPEQVRSRTGLRRVIRDWVVKNADCIIVPSAQAAAAYPATSHQPATSNLYSVIPIIHDTSTMRKNAERVYAMGAKWRHEHCPSEWSRILLFVGRLAEIKNIPWIVDRLAELPETTGLVLVGAGPMEVTLREKVSAMGLEGRVIFAGRRDGDELYSIMACSDALVLASISETFGAVVAEGLGWGLPCAVSDNCGSAVLIKDGINGAVFKYGNREDFKSALARLPKRSGESLLSVELRDAVAGLVEAHK